jgi:hypothetical protein
VTGRHARYFPAQIAVVEVNPGVGPALFSKDSHSPPDGTEVLTLTARLNEVEKTPPPIGSVPMGHDT